tara:strand:+ start:769 stop:3327 length:2559 start_codon:yes stop_codon:yes gene_type:complete
MAARSILIILLCSFSFSYSINYVLENIQFNSIDNHFIVEKSTATIKKEKSTYDIYRLEFIVSDSYNIDYKIKNIEWVETGHPFSILDNNQLINVGDMFNYRGCPTIYVDIFPYKIINNTLHYIKNLEIEFIINENHSYNFCVPSNNIINKEFIFNTDMNTIKNTEMDYLVITNNSLLNVAENLKNVHQDLEIDIVSISSIYNLYQDLDPEYAIREYVINQIDTFSGLTYLLILGDETVVPPIYNGSVPSDDYYSSVNLFTSNPQLSTGRIPITNSNDALNIINNIDNYIHNLYFPENDDYMWRMNVNLVSDDENNPNPNKYPELSHTRNSHILYEQIKENFISNTFYGIDYEPIQNSDGLLHVDFTSKLIENINNGVAVINYIGHGNYNTLADEKILKLDRDINLFNIQDYKLPIWIVGTCSFGEYDGKDSMTEALLLQEKSSIAVISTSRGIGETSNINYLTKLFDKINDYVETYDDNSRLGDLLRNAKNNSTSEHLFHLFGDPALPLPFPKNKFIIDDINYNDPDTSLFIGSNTEFHIGPDGPYGANINIFDQEQSITRIYDDETITYTNQGNSIYKGSFYKNVCFVTPLDASECQDCASIYIQTQDTPYNLFQNILNLDIVFNQDQIGDELTEDFSGPEMIFFTQDYRPLYDNDIVFDNSSIIVRLTDKSGINLMDGLGHSIRYWVDDEENQNIIDIQEFNYLSSCDSVAVGEFSIETKNFNLGYNNLFVEVWDNFNNKTLNSIKLKLENSIFKAYDVYNFPNPFQSNTQFTFKTSIYPSIAKISIFDLSGRRIKVIDKYECLNSFCNIQWNGETESGNKINNGTYIYHLEVTNGNESFKNSYKITKLK